MLPIIVRPRDLTSLNSCSTSRCQRRATRSSCSSASSVCARRPATNHCGRRARMLVVFRATFGRRAAQELAQTDRADDTRPSGQVPLHRADRLSCRAMERLPIRRHIVRSGVETKLTRQLLQLGLRSRLRRGRSHAGWRSGLWLDAQRRGQPLVLEPGASRLAGIVPLTSQVLGGFIGFALYPIQERIYQRRLAANGGKSVPEARIISSLVLCWLMPIGCVGQQQRN